MAGYISIRQLADQGQVTYDELVQRNVAEEKWAEDIYISPSDVHFNIVSIHYNREGFVRLDFHFVPSIAIDSVKGNIRNCVHRPSAADAVNVVDQNVIIHMNPGDDKNIPKLEVVVNRLK